MRHLESAFRAVFVLAIAFAAVLVGTTVSRFQTRVRAACYAYCGPSDPLYHCSGTCQWCILTGVNGNTSIYQCMATD